MSSAGMAGPVDRAPDLGDPRGDAGRGLVVDHADRLDAARAVLGERRLDPLRIDAVAPVAGQQLDLEPEAPRHLAPQAREMPGLRHQHAGRPARAC